MRSKLDQTDSLCLCRNQTDRNKLSVRIESEKMLQIIKDAAQARAQAQGPLSEEGKKYHITFTCAQMIEDLFG